MTPLYRITPNTVLGIIDSGIGGIPLLQKALRMHCKEIMYIADTAYMPYGTKSAQEIQQITARLITWLVAQGTDTVILACHTASAVAQLYLQQQFPSCQIIGIADMVVHHAIATSTTHHIGILATATTIAHQYHHHKLHNLDPDCIVYPQACPELAPAIEAGADTATLKKLVTEYTNTWRNTCIDTIIIGCTHYSAVQDIIQAQFSDAHLICAEQIMQQYIQADRASHPSTVRIYATAHASSVAQQCIRFFGLTVPIHRLEIPLLAISSY